MPELLESTIDGEMYLTVEFDVTGTPGPQGSKKPVGRRKNGSPILVESSKKVKPWQEAVIAAWRTDGLKRYLRPDAGPVYRQGVAVTASVEFRMARGKTVKRAEHTTYPDIDKLLRSTLDAMKKAGILYDDAQVTDFSKLHKRYALPGETTGAHIILTGIVG